jgi:hypothetical protein
MTLDIMVASAMVRARQLERAVHDRGPWTIRRGSESFPASRLVHARGVTFIARTPDLCWLSQEPLDLYCGQDLVSSRPCEDLDGEQRIEWTLTLSSLAVA